MRVTLFEAAAALLDQPEGFEQTISVYPPDGLTGWPDGVDVHGNVMRHVKVRVEYRVSGNKRTKVVAEMPLGNPLAHGSDEPLP